MATLQTVDTRTGGTDFPAGKAYFETSTNKFIIWNGSQWIELHSDGTGAGPAFDAWSTGYVSASAQYLDFSAARGALDSTSTFSISTWFKYTSFATSGVLWSSGTKGSRLSGAWYNGGNISFTVRGGQGSHGVYASTSAPSLDTWAHLVCVFDNGQGTIYVTPTDTGITTSATATFVYQGTTVSTTDTNGGDGLRCGIFSHALVQGLDGNINDFAVWGSALSSSDVATIYGAGLPTNISSLNPYGFWKMGDDANDSPVDGGAVSGIQDSSGNGYHAVTNVNYQPTFSTSVPS